MHRDLPAYILMLCATVTGTLFMLNPVVANRGVIADSTGKRDLGRVRQRSQSTFAFTLRNASHSQAFLKRVATACVCTGYELEHTTLAPGETTPLRLTLDTSNLRGRVTVAAAVFYQIDNQKTLRVVTVGGEVQIDPDIVAQPDSLRFATGTVATKTITLTPRYVDALKIKAVHCDKRFLSASIVSASPSCCAVAVSFDPMEYSSDAGEGHLYVLTDHTRDPTIALPIHITEGQ